ncbi:hypothetical protein E2C01_018579 [Portunus trituberculatus]|uniref:Uncharacterized protein n=1 Tax=Portunus trituberculatus TaxID=210409 RepID=A0A5B7DWY0_PORTR|nr:hypothetical protein [Portunus trituberculatus]
MVHSSHKTVYLDPKTRITFSPQSSYTPSFSGETQFAVPVPRLPLFPLFLVRHKKRGKLQEAARSIRGSACGFKAT